MVRKLYQPDRISQEWTYNKSKPDMSPFLIPTYGKNSSYQAFLNTPLAITCWTGTANIHDLQQNFEFLSDHER